MIIPKKASSMEWKLWLCLDGNSLCSCPTAPPSVPSPSYLDEVVLHSAILCKSRLLTVVTVAEKLTCKRWLQQTEWRQQHSQDR